MTRSLDSELDSVHTEFEQRLFASARSDEPPAGETERAWQRFAARAGALAPLAVAASTPPVWWRSARASALKWTLLGALGGGSIVAVWLRPPLSAGASHGDAVVLPGVPAGALTRAAVLPEAVLPEVAPSSAAGAAPEVAAATAATAAPAATRAAAAASASTASATERHPQRRASPAAQPRSAPARPSSAAVSAASLAREVAALDAARSALAIGANGSALRQIEQYRRDFPAGELAADADVVAIEALAADGERAAARRAAELFLERHPHDPHAARVRELGR